MQRQFLRDNGLSVALLSLFFAFWVGQAFTGYRQFNEEQRTHGEQPLAFASYLSTSHFWEATSENWESEFLQIFAYVVLTAILVQRGSAESKDPDEPEPTDRDPRTGEDRAPHTVAGAPRGAHTQAVRALTVYRVPAALPDQYFHSRRVGRGGVQRGAARAWAGHPVHASVCGDVPLLVRILPELAERVHVHSRHGRVFDLPAAARVTRIEARGQPTPTDRDRLSIKDRVLRRASSHSPQAASGECRNSSGSRARCSTATSTMSLARARRACAWPTRPSDWRPRDRSQSSARANLAQQWSFSPYSTRTGRPSASTVQYLGTRYGTPARSSARCKVVSASWPTPSRRTWPSSSRRRPTGLSGPWGGRGRGPLVTRFASGPMAAKAWKCSLRSTPGCRQNRSATIPRSEDAGVVLGSNGSSSFPDHDGITRVPTGPSASRSAAIRPSGPPSTGRVARKDVCTSRTPSADAEGTELRAELGPACCVVAVSHSDQASRRHRASVWQGGAWSDLGRGDLGLLLPRMMDRPRRRNEVDPSIARIGVLVLRLLAERARFGDQPDRQRTNRVLRKRLLQHAELAA